MGKGRASFTGTSAATWSPAQIVAFGIALIPIVGNTVILKVDGVPVQLTTEVYNGVTVILDVTGALVLLVAVNEAIFPEPDAVGMPIAPLSFAHEKVVLLAGVLLKAIVCTVEPLQMV